MRAILLNQRRRQRFAPAQRLGQQYLHGADGALADAVVGTGEGWIGDLSDDELRELVVYHEEAVT